MKPPPLSQAARSQFKSIRKPFFTALCGSFVLLQLLFLGNLSYLYGTQFHGTARVKNFHVLMVDYDGGIVGQSLAGAYQALRSDSFPTVYQGNTDDYATVDDIKEAVCRGPYWAAIYSNADASTRLSDALHSEAAAAEYQSSGAASYIWNEARYSAESEAEILANIEKLVIAARSVYYELNGTAVTQFANLTTASVLNVFVDPIEATEINIQPTAQGPRVLYNTVTMVLAIIQQFFFLMALNGVSGAFQLYVQLGPLLNGLLRAVISFAYTFLGSLCTAGYIWAFRENWGVDSNQFVLTWMVFWLYMHVNFLVLDTATAYIPMQFLPFFVLTWAITNVASTVTPFETNPGFYHWGYALPAHEAYQLLVEIWSKGCARQVYRALPILVAWWIVGMVVVIIANYHRCANALTAHNAEQRRAKNAAAVDRAISIPQTKQQGMEGDYSDRPNTNSSTLPIMSPTESETRRQSQSYELSRLEQTKAYSPSYPTPFVNT